MKLTTATAAIILLSSVCSPAGAAAISIDFETYPGTDGIIGTADDEPVPPDCNFCPAPDYSPLGVSIVTHDGTTGTIINYFTYKWRALGPLTLFFMTPVTDITFYSGGAYNLTAKAYDGASNLLYDRLLGAGAVVSIDAGGPVSTLSLDPGAIDRVVLLDNFSAVQAVPEPGTYGVVGALAILTAVLSKRRGLRH